MAASLSGRPPAPPRDPVSPSRRPIRILALAALLCVLVLVPRLAATDVFVTTDELFWLGRAGDFARGLSQGRLDATLQTGHPGVTTMWTAVASLGLPRAEAFAGPRREVSRREVSEHPDFIPALAQARRGVALVTGLACLLLAGLAWRLYGPLSGLLAGGLLAFEPFLLAHSRLLHIDAELASLTALAIVSALTVWLGRAPLALMALAGLATGLALLSKAPAFLLVGFIPLMGLWVGGLAALRRPRFWLALCLWGIVAAATYVTVWPAMWTSPLGTLSQVVAFMRDNANPPRLSDAATERSALGPVFYWFTLLLRASPVTLAGLLLAIVACFTVRVPEQFRWRTTTLALLAFAVVFGLFMTFAAKNFDRYLLPVFPLLGLVAGFGWAALARALAIRAPRMVALVAVAVVAVQASLALATAPYYLSYFNPLSGRSERAAGLVASAWGEGLDQVARYLDSHPNPERLRVALPGEIYTTVLGAQTRAQVGPAEGADASAHDYLVVYARNVQLGELPPFFEERFHAWTPELEVRLNGIPYAWVYDTRHGAPVNVELAPGLTLAGYGLSTTATRAGQRLEVVLHWRGDGRAVQPELAMAREGESPVAMAIGAPRVAPNGESTRTTVTLPESLAPGEYTILVRLAAAGGAASEGSAGPVSDPEASPWVPLRTIEVRPNQRSSGSAGLTPTRVPDDPLAEP